MSTPDALPDQERADRLAERRTKVRQLADQRLSRRAIAARLGISKDTVSRDLAHLALAETRDGSAGARHEPAPPETPAETPAPPMSHPDPVALLAAQDPQLAEDLATLTACGRSAPSAVAIAVHLLADAYRNGWRTGTVPLGREPQIDIYRLKTDR